jgi:hypothetical protein
MLQFYRDHTEAEFLAQFVRQLIREGRPAARGKNLSQLVREDVRSAKSQRGKKAKEKN